MINTNLRSCLWAVLLVMAVCNPLQAADDQVQVIPEAQLEQWWLPPPEHPNIVPQYPLDAIKSGLEGCMAVAFEIQSDGNVSNERIWRDKTRKFHGTTAWELSTLLAVHKWHFIPAPTNTKRAPVYTYQPVTFTLSHSDKWTKYDRARHDKLESQCEIHDFPQEVRSMINSQPKPSSAQP